MTRIGRKPGGPKTGGRRKGTPNRVTADVREAVAAIAKNNTTKVQSWLDRAAKKDPAKALELYLRLLEYHIPKLARSEVTGAGGVPLRPSAIVVPVKDLPRTVANMTGKWPTGWPRED